MNSQNHVMLLGDLIVWWYENLGGIKSDEANPGFKKIIMKPLMIDGLDYVNASYHSVHGLIKSNWKKDGDRFTWNVRIPANTKALMYLPATGAEHIKEGSKGIRDIEGVKLIGVENNRVILEVGSGNYDFEINNFRVVKK
jgi:alpha-L-rhamnosidase